MNIHVYKILPICYVILPSLCALFRCRDSLGELKHVDQCSSYTVMLVSDVHACTVHGLTTSSISHTPKDRKCKHHLFDIWRPGGNVFAVSIPKVTEHYFSNYNEIPKPNWQTDSTHLSEPYQAKHVSRCNSNLKTPNQFFIWTGYDMILWYTVDIYPYISTNRVDSLYIYP